MLRVVQATLAWKIHKLHVSANEKLFHFSSVILRLVVPSCQLSSLDFQSQFYHFTVTFANMRYASLTALYSYQFLQLLTVCIAQFMCSLAGH